MFSRIDSIDLVYDIMLPWHQVGALKVISRAYQMF